MVINCVAYQNGQKLGDISVEAISDYVVRPDCFVWVALFEPDDGELEQMAEEFGLHVLIDSERALHAIEEYGSSMFTVLQTVDIDPAAPDGDFIVGEVAIFVGRNYVLSVRRKTPLGFKGIRARAEAEPENLARGAGFVLYAIMDTVVDRYFPVLARLEADLERLETEIFRTSPSAKNIEAFYDLKYRLMVLKHAVASLMEATAKMFGGRVPSVCLGSQEYFRDVFDHLVRINAAIDGALITVPTLLAGIYGMNFEHMPELKWAAGYPLTLASMILIDVFLFFKFRRYGWL